MNTPVEAQAPSPQAVRTGSQRRSLAAGEEGAEVVSYVLVQAMVLIVVLAVLQLGFALHIRNMTIAAASEGARRGAMLAGSDASAIERTESMLDSMWGSARERTIETGRTQMSGREVLVVTVTTDLPVLASWGPKWLTVTGSAVVEAES